VERLESLSTDAEAIDKCAIDILHIVGEGRGALAAAAKFGEQLARGPQTLADMTAVMVWAHGVCADGMKREEKLLWRKRTMRLLDCITLSGFPIFEHRLSNGQLLYGLSEGAR